MPTKKITKKELKEPDQFQSLSQRIYAWTMDHRRTIYRIAAVVAVIAVTVLGWYLYQARYEGQASRLYAQAYGSYETLLHPANQKEAIEGALEHYETLIREYPASRAALTARYNLGNLFYSLGQYDASINAYQSYLQDAPRRSMLRPLALYGLGYAYEALENHERALDYFKQAATRATDEYFRSMNYANSARIYEAMGNHARAIEYYEMALQGDIDPLTSVLLKGRIASLK